MAGLFRVVYLAAAGEVRPALRTDGLAAGDHALALAGRAVAVLHAAEPEGCGGRRLEGEDQEEECAEEADPDCLKRSIHFNLPSFTKVLRALEA
jgi:hypothetical protein